MFISDNDVIDVIIYYRKLGRSYVAYGEEDFKEEIVDEKEKEKFKKFTITMKLLTWGLFNEIQELSTTYDVAAFRGTFNARKYKEEKLKKLIVKWDATTTDKDGKIINVPVTEKSILSLSPNVAETIINSYERLSVLDDDNEKK